MPDFLVSPSSTFVRCIVGAMFKIITERFSNQIFENFTYISRLCHNFWPRQSTGSACAELSLVS